MTHEQFVAVLVRYVNCRASDEEMGKALMQRLTREAKNQEASDGEVRASY